MGPCLTSLISDIFDQKRPSKVAQTGAFDLKNYVALSVTMPQLSTVLQPSTMLQLSSVKSVISGGQNRRIGTMLMPIPTLT